MRRITVVRRSETLTPAPHAKATCHRQPTPPLRETAGESSRKRLYSLAPKHWAAGRLCSVSLLIGPGISRSSAIFRAHRRFSVERERTPRDTPKSRAVTNKEGMFPRDFLSLSFGFLFGTRCPEGMQKRVAGHPGLFLIA